MKLYRKIQRTKSSDSEFIILTFSLVFRMILKLKKCPTEALLSFQSEQTEASQASDFMVIFMRNKNMSFGLISDNWVNYPNWNDSSGQRVCLHSSLSYFDQSMSRGTPRGMNKDLGWDA